jgi:hypothetical protein
MSFAALASEYVISCIFGRQVTMSATIYVPYFRRFLRSLDAINVNLTDFNFISCMVLQSFGTWPVF